MGGDRVRPSAFLVQGLSTFAIAYLTSLTGLIYGWPSYTLEMFQSNGTVLSAPMSSMEVSLLGSLTNVGGLLATPFCGYAVNKFGRKYAAIMYGLPFVISWGIISVARWPPLIILAVALGGLGAAGQAVSSVYISEIAQDSIRGALTSTTVSGYFVGLLFSYAIGGQLSYHHVAYVHLVMSVMYMVILTFLKESPVYLIQIGKDKEAAESLAFYRRVPATSKEVEVEITKIKLQMDPRIDKILQGENDPNATKELIEKQYDQTPRSESQWKFLMKSESSQRAMVAVLLVMSVTILMGSIVLQVYAEPLFKEAVPTMQPNLCSVLLAVTYLLASFLCAFMIDKFGRRPLLTVTSVGSALCNFVLGSQLHLRWGPHWLTAATIYAYSFIYNFGAAVVPFVLTAEVFLPEVRGLGNSMSMACMWIMNFVTLIIFNPLVDWLGLGPVFYVFSGTCLLGATYSHFWLPETKGLPADAIQKLFLKKEGRDKKVVK
ncbi:Facilitated trehalose transporter Tret1 [Papilio xuthus]|uniref:Facilitated trehalose transporter Tret1 n=1 Tax=Papilio xuthus TaxID=66420 RepID=A0A0N1IQK5_PAPXU|nr:Facilitated trehalose transporter Tret1 [Papilio xuthus]